MAYILATLLDDPLESTLSSTRGAIAGGWFATGDHPLNTSTFKHIFGKVYDRYDAIVPGATVLLIRQFDNLLIATQTTNAEGAYVFNRRSDDTDEYYTVAYSIAGGTTQIHGTSDRGMVPS